MKKKTLTKTICFKTTPENYLFLKDCGNINAKLNALVSHARAYFEYRQSDMFYKDVKPVPLVDSLCLDDLSLSNELALEIPLDDSQFDTF